MRRILCEKQFKTKPIRDGSRKREAIRILRNCDLRCSMPPLTRAYDETEPKVGENFEVGSGTLGRKPNEMAGIHADLSNCKEMPGDDVHPNFECETNWQYGGLMREQSVDFLPYHSISVLVWMVLDRIVASAKRLAKMKKSPQIA